MASQPRAQWRLLDTGPADGVREEHGDRGHRAHRVHVARRALQQAIAHERDQRRHEEEVAVARAEATPGS